MYKKRKANADTGQCQQGRPERHRHHRLHGHARRVYGDGHGEQRAQHEGGGGQTAHRATVEAHVEVLVDGCDLQTPVDGHEQPEDERIGERNAVDALEHGAAAVELFARVACG